MCVIFARFDLFPIVCSLSRTSYSKSKYPYFTYLITICTKNRCVNGVNNRQQSCFHVNSLRPSDAIWRQWSWTTLAQVMACCLTAPSHYLNQCWLITRGVLWHTSESSFAGIAQGIDSGYEFEKDILKNIFKSPRGQWVNLPKRARSNSDIRHHYAAPTLYNVFPSIGRRSFQPRKIEASITLRKLSPPHWHREVKAEWRLEWAKPSQLSTSDGFIEATRHQ